MVKWFVLLIITGFLTAGCAGVDVYTFKKDRVDQEIKGNQGYLSGEASKAPAGKREKKRTLIGVDIELPSGETSFESEEEVRIQPQRKEEPQPAVRKKPVKKISTEQIVEQEVVVEEEWIK